jgi:plastocyanin
MAFALLLLAASPARASSDEARRSVEAIDNVFSPRIVRIPVGGTVEWSNDGRSPHTVIADDEAFGSDVLDPGDAFEFSFDRAGAFPYHCSLHGAPGVGMTGLVLVGDAQIPGGASDVGPGREAPPSLPGETIHVPEDVATIQEAVDDAEPGGLVLIAPGEYAEAVVVTTPSSRSAAWTGTRRSSTAGSSSTTASR